jgi:hypothetical protein
MLINFRFILAKIFDGMSIMFANSYIFNIENCLNSTLNHLQPYLSIHLPFCSAFTPVPYHLTVYLILFYYCIESAM